MKYIFNFENREKPIQFNREKLLLSALQQSEQLYYMMDSQYEGIYQAEALERKRRYGSNAYRHALGKSKYRFFPERKQMIRAAFDLLETQQISVFRKGMHFYSEIDYEDLVPGDVIFLTDGDVVPSDVRIVFSKELEVDQSIYTGNGKAVGKKTTCEAQMALPLELTDLPNICLAGTRVVKGMARGMVVGTGEATYLCHLLLSSK